MASAPELKLIVEDKRSAIDVFTTWLPRIAVAVAFLFIGQGKFASQSMWVRIFDQIGFGQWFRYLTGTLQIVGAVLVLIPRTFTLGIVTLACTMLGAVLAWLVVLRAPGNAPVPGVLLVIYSLRLGHKACDGSKAPTTRWTGSTSHNTKRTSSESVRRQINPDAVCRCARREAARRVGISTIDASAVCLKSTPFASVRRGPLDVINDEEFNCAPYRFQLQTELLLKSGEDRCG